MEIVHFGDIKGQSEQLFLWEKCAAFRRKITTTCYVPLLLLNPRRHDKAMNAIV